MTGPDGRATVHTPDPTILYAGVFGEPGAIHPGSEHAVAALAQRSSSVETLSMLNRSAEAVRVERLDDAVVPVYRGMTSAERVAAGLSATDMIRDRLRATIGESHPEWTEEAVAWAASERMLGARG